MIKILRSILPNNLFSFLQRQYGKRQLKRWKREKCPVPPPSIVKKKTIQEYQRRYGYNILIETGTYLGDMIDFQKKNFRLIISIELSTELYEKAEKRFRKNKNIHIIPGDSGKILPKILNNINEPAIFWLDGHYCGGETARGEKISPILEEINSILNNKNINHILIIDDARYFDGTGDYPSIEELTKYIKNKNSKYEIIVKNDLILCVAKGDDLIENKKKKKRD